MHSHGAPLVTKYRKCLHVYLRKAIDIGVLISLIREDMWSGITAGQDTQLRA